MKKIYKISVLLLMMSALAACSVKSTGSKVATTSATNPIGTTPGPVTPGPVDPTNPGGGCDGVFHDGATQCYYKNIPTIQVMGATTSATSSGTPYWTSSSLTAPGSGISPNQFATDGTFNVRIIPRFPSSTVRPANPSVTGKTCSAFSPTRDTFKKLYVQVRLRQQNATTGEVATLSADMDLPSSVWHFTPPVSTQPLILEVINVMADIRCNWSGGKYYCPFADIPINYPSDSTRATECVAFDLQFSTDTTYDLPGPRAN